MPFCLLFFRLDGGMPSWPKASVLRPNLQRNARGWDRSPHKHYKRQRCALQANQSFNRHSALLGTWLINHYNHYFPNEYIDLHWYLVLLVRVWFVTKAEAYDCVDASKARLASQVQDRRNLMRIKLSRHKKAQETIWIRGSVVSSTTSRVFQICFLEVSLGRIFSL